MRFSPNDHEMSVSHSEDRIYLNTIHGEGVSLKLYEVRDVQLGGNDKKTKIVARFVDKDGVENNEDNFFVNEKEGMPDALKYFERWKFLRDIGLPVVPNVVVLDGNRVAMTDLAVNGAEFFGKAREWKLFRSEEEDLSEVESAFLKLNFSEVTKEIERIRKICIEKHLRLAWDDPLDLLVYPDGKFKVFVIDIQGTNPGEYNDGTRFGEDPLEYFEELMRTIKRELGYKKGTDKN